MRSHPFSLAVLTTIALLSPWPGDIFVATRATRDSAATGGVLALRDVDGDGRADRKERFGDTGGTGISLWRDHLYFAPNDAVLRYRYEPGSLEPAVPPDTIVSGLPSEASHTAKTALIDDAGNLFVNIGAPSNTCQEEDRAEGSPGQDPCPQLENRGGIWRFDVRVTGQTQADGERYATGLRNTFALAIHPSGDLYGVQHGRDQLHQNWPALFTEEEGAHKPSEELVRIERGADFGWPYCYHDPEVGHLVLAPEYGGDGEEVGRCADKTEPVFTFPAHWAPEALLFYTGPGFPELPRRRVHRFPRLLEPGTVAPGRIQRGLSAVRRRPTDRQLRALRRRFRRGRKEPPRRRAQALGTRAGTGRIAVHRR